MACQPADGVSSLRPADQAPTGAPWCRVIMRNLDVGVNADGVINMIHDYTQVGKHSTAQHSTALYSTQDTASIPRMPSALPHAQPTPARPAAHA